MQLFSGGYVWVKPGFIEAPHLSHQPADAVALYRAGEFLFGYREARQNRGKVGFFAVGEQADDTYGKNRKRFPCPEKRINMLLSLEPLIYFESITNGSQILKNYLSGLTSDTVSLWRPLARREANTLRPFADSIRLRNP